MGKLCMRFGGGIREREGGRRRGRKKLVIFCFEDFFKGFFIKFMRSL